jgi:hypothetical protein
MRLALLTAIAGLAFPAVGANVYILSSGNSAIDGAAAAALTSRGHTVTVGVEYGLFDGSVSLAGFQTVYLQCNANWTMFTMMPVAGQQQLIDWVNAGGRLVTSEWVIYYTYSGGGKFETLGPILPGTQTFQYGQGLGTTYTSVTPDPAINAGLPSSFAFSLTSYTGTETFSVVKPGATTYYTTANSATAFGLAGWTIGSGSVYSFTSTCGPDQTGDANFGRLFSNVMGGGGGPSPCYANCDGSTAQPLLNVQDFGCFLNRFAAGDSYANCDGSTTPPTLTVQDFGCFLNAFAAGCT